MAKSKTRQKRPARRKTIDIYKYVDRWMNNYIVYHSGHLLSYEDIPNAKPIFEANFQEGISRLQDRNQVAQAEAIINGMRLKGKKAAKTLDVIQGLSDGDMLESVMDQIADDLNAGIELYFEQIGLENYDQFLEELSSEVTTKEQKLKNFFDYILKALYAIGKISKELLNTMTDIGSYVTGTNFSLDKSWSRRTSRTLSEQDIKNCNEVIEVLNSMADEWKDGEFSTYAFGKALKEIFRESIGNQMARKSIAKALQIIDDTVTESFEENLNIKAKGKSRTSLIKPYSGNSQVDVFNQRAMSVTVKENGMDYQIDIATNINVIWGGNSQWSDINIQTSASVGDFFPGASKERHAAYNLIAHQNTKANYYNEFRLMKASIAANFFSDWLSGSGSIMKNNQVDTAQFLMVNGKVYSIMSIIRNICNEVAQNTESSWRRNTVITMNMDDVSNKWVGGDYTPNISYALLRSRAVSKVIDTLTIAATLNNNILTKYAY